MNVVWAFWCWIGVRTPIFARLVRMLWELASDFPTFKLLHTDLQHYRKFHSKETQTKLYLRSTKCNTFERRARARTNERASHTFGQSKLWINYLIYTLYFCCCCCCCLCFICCPKKVSDSLVADNKKEFFTHTHIQLKTAPFTSVIEIKSAMFEVFLFKS